MDKNPCPPGCPGWVTFGSHVDTTYQGKLDWKGKDDGLMPIYERHTRKRDVNGRLGALLFWMTGNDGLTYYERRWYAKQWENQWKDLK